MRIKEIYDFQRDSIKSINASAAQIHPKLLSRLSYKDFFNNEFMDDTLMERYTSIIEPMVKKYRSDIQQMCEEYLLGFIEDMAQIFGEIGYNLSDGCSLNEHDVGRDLFAMDYLPSPEIAPVWDEVHSELMGAYSPVPFWQTGSYWITGNKEKVYIEGHRTPKAFIAINSEKFGHHYGLRVMDNVLRDVAVYHSFEYNIHIEPLTAQEERNVPNNLHEAVQRHSILRHVIEEMGVENIEPCAYHSKITHDGKVTLSSFGV